MMDNLDRKLESAENEMSEEVQSETNDHKSLTDAVDKVDAGDGNGTCVTSSQENNGCVCRVCNFVAKTPTALKIHCKRKHNGRTSPTDQSSTIVPPAEQPDATPLSSTDHLSISVPSEDQFSSTVSSTDQPSTTLSPGGHPSTETLEHLHCKCCSFYTSTVEEMHTHLSEEAHQKCATEKNMEPLFERCVEKVIVFILDEQKDGGTASECNGDVGGRVDEVVNTAANEGADTEHSAEQTSSKLDTEDKSLLKRKRGRPKSSQVTSCSHCGLVASNPTNLSVHIRRRHSRMYSFHCRVCKYSCVTKGDMDRHCETKKHVKRVQSDGDGQEVIVSLSTEHGTEQENVQNAEEQEVPAIQEEAESEGMGSDIPAKRTRCDGNTCVHCDFVAHSALSLDLHVRRKHTKTFEFVCLACSYYAVTHKEMSRHTATEKHKHKRLRYLQKRQAGAQDPTDTQPTPDGVENGNMDAVNPPKNENDKDIEETDSNPKNTNGRKDELDATPPANTVVAISEKGDAENVDDKDNEEDTMTAESPSAETPLFQATQFDECVFSLKAHKEDLEGNEAEMSNSLTKTLKPSEGQEQEGNTRIQCDDCGFLAEGMGGLNVHITMKHPSKEKGFHCLLCGKSFYSDSSLQQHLSSSTHLRTEHGSVDERPDGGSAFRCVRCNEPCASEQDLFIHIKEKHEELLHEVNKYVVEDTEQINRERQENPGNVCKYCGKVCKSSNSIAFLAHIRTHTGSKPFMCKICNFATAQLGDARTHVKRHLGMREYKCHLCGWAFVMKKHLNTHLLGKHGLGQPKDRKYECELCERSFIEKWALNNHMKLHTGDKPFKCNWPSCHYSFLTLSAMKDHYRTHTGEKSFLCDLCGFAGGTRHALTKHRRQHTGERPFRCDLCSFASTTQSHLTRHKRVHTGEKPYRCPWCDYRSNCAENIRKHILHTGKHEGVMMYNCPRCDYCTNTPSEFRNHLKEQHEDIENPDLAYLHAGIVSKSFECRLRGQGSAYVEADAPFMPDEGRLGAETLQQVIIIQGYGEEEELRGVKHEKAELEESAAATLQTLAMSSPVNAELLQVTQDGCFVPYMPKNYVLVESGAGQTLQGAGQSLQATDQESTGPSTALDALLCAVSEIDQQGSSTQQEAGDQQDQGQEAVQVYEEVVQVLGHTHQEVLQYAASQLMMKEGLTQVIVNDEGTHYIVTEVTESPMQEDGAVYAQTVAADTIQEAELGEETESKAKE